jgi:hypothetical protein
MTVLSLTAFLAVGCNTDGDDTTPTEEADRFADFVFVEDAPRGELTCYDGTTWLESVADPSCEATVPLTGAVENFEDGESVANATVELFYSDDVSTTADGAYVSDDNGALSGEIAVCQPIAYRVTTDAALAETKPTMELHTVFDAAKAVDTQFNSVSDVTYRLIPSLLGVSVDSDKGVLAGTAFDCNGDPVANAQVIVKDADGNIPESLIVKYFVAEFPNRDQQYTSDDGLWVAINVPVGTWSVEMYVSDGQGGHTLTGSTQLTVFADSINISNIYTGHPDGILVPESCQTTCAG